MVQYTINCNCVLNFKRAVKCSIDMSAVNLIRKKTGINRTFLLLRELSEVVIKDWQCILSGAIDLKEYVANSENIVLENVRLNRNFGVLLTNSEWGVNLTDDEIIKIVLTIQRLIDAGSENSGTLLTLNVAQG